MDSIKAKLAVWAKDKALVRTAAVVGAVMLLLIVCTCISIHMRANIQKKYSGVVEQLQTQVYDGLTEMSELFGRVDDPNVDVRYKLIPEMKISYAAVSTANTALTLRCGEKDAVLSAELTAAFDDAFEQYALAYRQGIATGLARADMEECMQQAQAILDLHNAPPKDEENEVVVIDASSGEVTTTVIESSSTN